MPGTPRPIPPVYAPEVVADAVVRLSLRPRREMWIGGSSVKAIVGQRIIARLLDRYLARHGYRDQQDAAPVEPYRPDNLFYPLEGDRGAHGPYLDLERRHSAQIWFDFHKRGMAATAAAMGLLAGALWARARA